MTPQTISRRFRITVLVIFAALFGWILYGAQEALKTNTNDVRDWLPLEFEETQRLIEFSQLFGGEEFVLVSWPGCTLDDERQSWLAGQLRQPPATGEPPFFKGVVTGRDSIEQMMAPPLELSRAEAIRRLQGILIGPDGNSSSVAMSIADPATVNRHRLVDYVYECVQRIPGLNADSVRVAGTTVDGVAIDRASQERLLEITLCSFAACFLLMYAVFRCVRTAIMVFLIALFNQQATMALIYFSGWHMDSVLLMAPSLIFVVTISGGVHLANYYREAVRKGGLAGAPLRALREGWVPCLLSAVTTSLGIVSLMASYLVPVQKFGMYAALMVLIGTGVLFLLLPCLLEHWPSRRVEMQLRNEDRRHGLADRVWHTLSTVATRAYAPILILAVGGTLFALNAVTKTKCTAQLHDMFPPDARIVQDYDWLEATIGPLIPIEVAVRLPHTAAATEVYQTPIVDQLQLVGRIQKAMQQAPGMEVVVSALTFAPEIPPQKIVGLRPMQRAQARALERKLADNLDQFVQLGFLSHPIAAGDELGGGTLPTHWWRISGRVSASKRLDYRQVLHEVENRVREVVEFEAAEAQPPQVMFSGCIPLVQKAQEQMMKDLINSFLSAFMVIAVALVGMMLVLSHAELRSARSLPDFVRILARAVGAAFCSMLPNVFPCVAVFGFMGHAGIEIEVGTIMTATVAMGIAVDDTVHYISWFRRGYALGLPPGQAVQYAYRRCGTAMTQTSLIVGLGLLVYSLSAFEPIVRFGWLMFSTLTVALLADLTITPALLYSRIGRLYLPQAVSAPDASQPDPVFKPSHA